MVRLATMKFFPNKLLILLMLVALGVVALACDPTPTPPPEEQKETPTSGPTATPTPPPPPTHFIAIADRRVGGTVGLYHYSLEHWDCGGNYTPLNTTAGYTPAQIITNCKALNAAATPTKLAGVELLANTGWTVWAGRDEVFGSGRVWVTDGEWVSEIVYTDSATKIMPIFTGNVATTTAKWNTILGLARTYNWGEQTGFAAVPTFTKWPGSMYKSQQTNSNTFVRYLVTTSGLAMTEMNGSHPGNATPSQNTETQFNKPLSFYAAHTPWKGGTPKPKPAGTPP